MTDTLYFDSIKEKHETFFVKYRPPITNFPLALLKITYLGAVELDQVIGDLELQARLWVERYPIPVLASAFDEFGDLINLDKLKGSSHLTVIKREDQYEYHWELLEDDEFPKEALDINYLLSVYSDISYRTQAEVTAKACESIKSMQQIKILLLIWAVVIPVLIAVLEFFSPTWVAALALAYSFWKAYQKWLLMTGRKKKTEKEIAKEEEELMMRHHHYHCMQNPEAFSNMKIENFKRESREQVKNEFDSLKEVKG